MAASESAVRSPKKIPIIINDQQFKVEVPILGSALRELGQVPAENQLFEERHGQEPDLLIQDDASYEPKPGTHYYDLPRGTVGATSLETQLEYAAGGLLEGEHVPQPDGTYLLRWRTTLPPGWEPPETRLMIVVPPAYPAQAPSGFDTIGALTQNGATPGGSGARDLAGMSCMHFCWNPAGTIDYSAADGLWRFAKFSEKRFLA